MNSDKEFEKFLEDSDPNLFFLMATIRGKLKYVSEIYKTTLENLSKIPDIEMMKKINVLIDDLISDYRISINQLDILISEELGEDSDKDSGENSDFGGDL